MSDHDWMRSSYEPRKLASPSAKREPLFAMSKAVPRLECSLLFHGEFGVKAQFTIDGELHVPGRSS
jgi:hypothetical protein